MAEFDLAAVARPPRDKRKISRQLTSTPLARRHEHLLALQLPGKRAIKWSAFERNKYPQPALDLAFHAQTHLAIGEYGAITLFARIASALALHGAPFDIVGAAAMVPGDEARHADMALRMAALCAGREPHEVAIEIDADAIEKSWQRPIDLATLDNLMVEIAAISETLAAALLGACRRSATDPVARTLFTSIVGDEVHHARLGWFYLSWRAPEWSRAERQRVANHAASIIVDIERRFWIGRDAPRGSRAAARALGVLDSLTQRATIRHVMEDEILPGLDAFGLGASHAWKKRRKQK